jgi:hypothetical protein
MPSRKQRRRQAKERRHDYEYVYVDDDGREIEVDEAELEERRNGKAKRPEPARAVTRGGRTVQPPSWSRVGKRALIFAPLMFVTVMLLGGKQLGTVGVAAQTLVLLGIFLPFSYFMDSVTYRAAQRRLNRDKTR